MMLASVPALPPCRESARIRARLRRRVARRGQPKVTFETPAPPPVVDVDAELRRLALRLGRQLAQTRDLDMLELFDDSLEGELARRAVLLRLRRERPSTPLATLDAVVEEALAP